MVPKFPKCSQLKRAAATSSSNNLTFYSLLGYLSALHDGEVSDDTEHSCPQVQEQGQVQIAVEIKAATRSQSTLAIVFIPLPAERLNCQDHLHLQVSDLKGSIKGLLNRKTQDYFRFDKNSSSPI